ncbi:MFS transporter [Comamonas testosteroni TK102]|uniref:MFS transporter n=1 Tax=Comamonas testosteroni TK102 TaxID=1392005 RepID=A0A076PJD1_COMTE|nr:MULTISPECIES: tripartite tricarboxylate transporter substrate binding protein [Comamonas]AIJ45733.1 MFS transporter [Comamonas testosteroni TK102]MPS87102.1 tripartite tricarboxylate transporter substrate binding protein [Comamonas sp.]
MHPAINRRRALAVLGSTIACQAAPSAALAQAFPSKPVRIIVPYPTGGFNDTLARLAAAKLTLQWKQPVIVDNRPGAGTTIGTQAAANAAPDGHTLLVVQFPFAANPWLYKKLPYDTQKAFAPVILAGRSPMLLLSHAGSSLRTLQDVVNAAKAKPGQLNYGTSGPGSSNHLAMALFERRSGTHMNQVPYKGSTPLLTDLAGGQVELAVDLLPHALPFIQSGKVRPLAIATSQRSPLMPELPTAAELGVAGYEAAGWHGFVVPQGTPTSVVTKINRDLNAMLIQDDVRKIFAQQGVVPDGGTPEQFSTFIDSQLALWKKVVEDARITAE